MTLNRHSWDGTRPPVEARNVWGEAVEAPLPTAGTVLRGSIVYAEPGVQVWSRTRGRRGVGADGVQEEPLGGVLLSLGQTLDPETGEVRRTYRCLDPYGRELRYYVLDESEVGESSFEPMSPSRCVRLLRRLCEAVAYDDRGRRRQAGPYTPEHSGLLHDALVLDRVLLPPQVQP